MFCQHRVSPVGTVMKAGLVSIFRIFFNVHLYLLQARLPNLLMHTSVLCISWLSPIFWFKIDIFFFKSSPFHFFSMYKSRLFFLPDFHISELWLIQKQMRYFKVISWCSLVMAYNWKAWMIVCDIFGVDFLKTFMSGIIINCTFCIAEPSYNFPGQKSSRRQGLLALFDFLLKKKDEYLPSRHSQKTY